MSASTEAPRQFSQPSRKGKKAWRKNVDITEVQEGLRILKDEEIKGGVIAEKPSDELFVIDTTGSAEVRKAIQKKRKLLKSEEIIAQRSAIPGVDTRTRSNSKVTDGVIEPKHKKQKGDWVTRKDWLRLKQVAKEGKPVNKTESDLYDPWADAEDSTRYDDPKFDFLEKPKQKVEPVTLKHAPISLAANGKPIPAVRPPTAGTSYNPTFEDWDKLLQEQGEKAVEAEKARLEEERKEQERQRMIAEAKDDDGEVKSDDESAWEGFESEYEKPDWLNKKRPERKTKTQRNKVKRRKEAERQAKWEAQMKKRQEQYARANVAPEDAEGQELELAEQSEDSSSDEGDDTLLRRRPLGKLHAPEKPLEVVLPDELQDSLRLLKPEGNLLDDRFRTLVVQGKLEARKPVTQVKKPKRKITEKWSHKDFKVPGFTNHDAIATGFDFGMDLKNLSSNWKKLQGTLKQNNVSITKRKLSDRETQNATVKKRRTDAADGKPNVEQKKATIKKKRMSQSALEGGGAVAEEVLKSTSQRNPTTAVAESKTSKINEGRSPTAELGKYVAMDCEMVGVGPDPENDSALARVSIVNFNGEQIYDSYVRPKEMVTDWRTHVSGILPKHMVNARSLEQVQKEVTEILNGRILVGHALSNDLDALLLSHPKRDIRDTSKHQPYRKIAGGGSPRLKMLASEFLGLNIQDGAHSSVEDAKATMLLYRRDKDTFEREHLKKWPVRLVVEKEQGDDQKKKKKKKKKTRKR
ncbi:Nop53-domain-containing protein [Aspergillus homomorphus CBS 101889]|uniref:RNA exonuclease 4 n=1 Tax=Aspergillus homomorphus (strain CBS 101889) TaxID=1450537 RepID=A0A395HXJ7_ASPHC|nr:Nop53-domain-containing protein [Aspergillus homomorphus CBS 101889]RAL12155.1 Nop53-domain-containing protein [Aspergillus homomorphus CBS 101889]